MFKFKKMISITLATAFILSSCGAERPEGNDAPASIKKTTTESNTASTQTLNTNTQTGTGTGMNVGGNLQQPTTNLNNLGQPNYSQPQTFSQQGNDPYANGVAMQNQNFFPQEQTNDSATTGTLIQSLAGVLVPVIANGMRSSGGTRSLSSSQQQQLQRQQMLQQSRSSNAPMMSYEDDDLSY